MNFYFMYVLYFIVAFRLVYLKFFLLLKLQKFHTRTRFTFSFTKKTHNENEEGKKTIAHEEVV